MLLAIAILHQKHYLWTYGLMDLWELLIEDFRRFVFDAISKDNAWGGTALLSHTPYT
ncbi:hypothetical protein M486_2812 [Yersinia pestis 1045]|nr:hypothetical protein M486_2812 [Yersinia pestis 1045]